MIQPALGHTTTMGGANCPSVLILQSTASVNASMSMASIVRSKAAEQHLSKSRTRDDGDDEPDVVRHDGEPDERRVDEYRKESRNAHEEIVDQRLKRLQQPAGEIDRQAERAGPAHLTPRIDVAYCSRQVSKFLRR